MNSNKRHLDGEPTDVPPKKVARPLPSFTKMKVYVRIRPHNEKELQSESRSVVKKLDDQSLIFDPKNTDESFFFHGVKQKMRDIAKKQNKEMRFMFDGVFDKSMTNNDVYQGTVKEIIPALLDGYNCSVFVYGPTGTGKTFTMLGSEETPGITYLTMDEMYKQMEQLKEEKNFELRITYLEVYNENVHNLLHKGSGVLQLREDSINGVVVAGVNFEAVSSAEEMFELLKRGNANRTQHPTDANAESSRSHAVLTVFIKMQDRESKEVKLVKLTMIDLAGSERGAATNYRGMRFKEGSSINKSLLALGNCINNLADGIRHIPYRDSKLTRLLKDSLGGNCQTVMIACVAPTHLSYEDTYNTLKYATRANNIKTRFTKNVMTINGHIEHYKQQLAEMTRMNKELGTRNKELENKLKEAKEAGPKVNLTPWTEKINALYAEKLAIHEELLSLESKEKMLQWRIMMKSKTAAILENASRPSGVREERNSNSRATPESKEPREAPMEECDPMLDRIESSSDQLQGRVNSLQNKMSEVWEKKLQNKEKINALQLEIENAKMMDALGVYVKYWESEIASAEYRLNAEHKDHFHMVYSAAIDKDDSLKGLLYKKYKYCYGLLSGYNYLTRNMREDHEEIKRKLNGGCTVNWEVSPSNELKKKAEATLVFTELSLEGLRRCQKPEPLNLPKDNIIEFKIPDDGNDEETEGEENSTFILEDKGALAKKVANPLSRARSSVCLRDRTNITKPAPAVSATHREAAGKPFVAMKRGPPAVVQSYPARKVLKVTPFMKKTTTARKP